MNRNPTQSDPGLLAVIDQLNAEDREARSLVPEGQNRQLRRDRTLSMVIESTLRLSANEAPGPVRILRPSGSLPLDGGHTYPREGEQPLAQTSVTSRCHRCFDSTARTVPFWINAGWDVVQVDLCGWCTAWAIDLGCKPQLGEPRW